MVAKAILNSSAERRPKSQKAAKQDKPATGAREGSNAAKVLGLLKRPDGASLKELMKATGWLAHSVRGYLSGTVSQWMKLKLVSTKSEEGSAAIPSEGRLAQSVQAQSRRAILGGFSLPTLELDQMRFLGKGACCQQPPTRKPTSNSVPGSEPLAGSEARALLVKSARLPVG